MAVMNTDALAENQRALMAEVAEVRAALERHAGCPAQTEAAPAARAASATLDRVAATFSLSAFERRVLVMCAAVELDGSFASLCAIAHGDPASAYPTFSLALAAFEDAHWSALAPASPLRRWSLVTLARDVPLTSAPLRIDESILHEIAGLRARDSRLAPVLAPLASDDRLAPSLCEAVARTVSLLRGAGRTVVQLIGPDPAATAAVAASAFTALQADALAIDARMLPREPAELEALLQAWEREARLHDTALYLDGHGVDEPPDLGAYAFFAERAVGRIVLGGDKPLALTRRAVYAIAVAKPLRQEQRDLWNDSIGVPGVGDALAAQFDFSGQRIAAASAAIAGQPADGGAAGAWSAASAMARSGLDAVAQRLDCAEAAATLVLPARQSEALSDIVAYARNRIRVYEDWGMGRSGARGLGLSVLFHGPSGTGKTLAAEAIGERLALDVYRVDLSQLVSKYIGETEKNLRRVFDAAEDGGAILLFDECDALFGKRGEIQYGHDRYANVEVSYLLQRMEAYRGVAILTTNMRSAIDSAFLRRFRFLLDFPFPDYEQRSLIWQRSFPSAVPTEALDFTKIARLNVSGGSIRNIALFAAFLAAEAGHPVRMSDLLRAARSECLKMERTPSELEIGGWV